MFKNVLIITAHPDDLEIGCGGTVAKLIANGCTVHNLVMVRPSTEIRPGRNQDTVTKELELSKNILKFELSIFPTPKHIDGRPNLVFNNHLITAVESFIDLSEYDTIITHWKEDWHQEHRICFDLVTSLSRLQPKNILFMDQFPYNQKYTSFEANLFVDISDFVATKQQAMCCYDSYVDNILSDNILKYNSYRGSYIGKKFAETFHIGNMIYE